MPESRRVEIYCPKCEWRPSQNDRWMCCCFFSWNTFDTCGICPDCGHKWEETQCLACHKWSPHSDWYHEFNFLENSEQKEEPVKV